MKPHWPALKTRIFPGSNTKYYGRPGWQNSDGVSDKFYPRVSCLSRKSSLDFTLICGLIRITVLFINEKCFFWFFITVQMRFLHIPVVINAIILLGTISTQQWTLPLAIKSPTNHSCTFDGYALYWIRLWINNLLEDIG